MSKRINRIFTFLILLMAVLISGQSYAQKKKKKDKESVEDNSRLVEFYFIEGEKYFLLEDYAKAMDNFQKCLELDDKNDAVYYKIAEIYTKGERWEQAESFLLKAINLNTSNKYYYQLIIEVYTNLGNLDRAIAFYEEMISTLPGNEEYLLELAALYLFKNDLDNALSTYEKAEVYFGINPQITSQKQKVYLKQNQVDKAIEEGIKLMDAYPDEQPFIILLADIYNSNGMSDEARDLLEAKIEEDPDRNLLRLKLGELYRQQGSYYESVDQIKIAFKDRTIDPQQKINVLIGYAGRFPDPYDEKIALELGELLIEAHPESADAYLINADLITEVISSSNPENREELLKKAVKYYKNYIVFDGSKFNVWQNLLNLELQAGEFDELVKDADDAIEYFPNQPTVYLFAGIGYYSLGEYESAIYYFDQGRRLTYGNKDLSGSFYSYLGDTYHALEEFEKSDNAYEEALKINPDNYLVLNNYSYYLSLRGVKLESAREMSQKVVRKHPNNSAYLDTYAWILYKLEDYVEAEKILKKVLDSEDVNAVHFDHYGDILYKLGDENEAVKYWKKARELDNSISNINEKITNQRIIE